MSERFDDPYYARSDGLAESRYVFLGGNDLPARWRDGARFPVAELGFGTGLNFISAWQAWRESAGPGEAFDYIAFERYPLGANEMAKALSHWEELADLSARLLTSWSPEVAEFDLPGARLRLIYGDVRETLPEWRGIAGAWFLDGFAPARNPEMWEPGLMAAIAARTSPGGTFATYSAAGHVRRSLAAAGFEVTRRPGFGKKREMLAGCLPTKE